MNSKDKQLAVEEPTSPGCLRQSRLRKAQFIKVLSPTIDNLLNGGVRSGIITEFVGEGGSGKTQICLQLALTAQLPPRLGGLYGISVYYCCEYVFPTRRMEAMKEAINKSSTSAADMVTLDNVLVCKVNDCDELRFQLLQLEKLCIERAETCRHVRVVIIESIASLFRSQFNNNKTEMTERSKYFTSISCKLNEIATRYNVAIVVTNQVSDDFSGYTHTTNNNTLLSVHGRRLVPSLGMAWANCVHNRIYLKISPGGSSNSTGRRAMKILYSPYLPEGECFFTITKKGVE